MLSAETTIGRHPLLVVRMMDRIVRAAESTDSAQAAGRTAQPEDHPLGYAAAVTHAARVLAEDLDASAIVGITRSGLTAELLSRGRARVPVFAFCPDPGVCRRLALWWGVTPVYQSLVDELEPNFAAMEAYLTHNRVVSPGDTLVITGSHPFQVGIHTNFVQYRVLGGT
jgi:pyruvate kinase